MPRVIRGFRPARADERRTLSGRPNYTVITRFPSGREIKHAFYVQRQDARQKAGVVAKGAVIEQLVATGQGADISSAAKTQTLSPKVAALRDQKGINNRAVEQ